VTVLRAIGLPPDPFFIARALANRPGLAVLASRPQGAPRPEDARYSFVACDPVERSDALVPPQRPLPSPGYGGAPAPPRWIGVLPYDAFRHLERPAWTRWPDARPPSPLARPVWQRYAAVLRVDHFSGEVAVEADDEASAVALVRAAAGAPAPADFAIREVEQPEDTTTHLERVRTALRLIAAGDLYQVNLARRIPLKLRGDGVALFEALCDSAPAPWAFMQDLGDTLVLGSSPELLLSVRGDSLRTCPIKGTRPRGRDAEDDAGLARALGHDPKERAELVMAIDVHRNDLGRVAAPGSVRVVGEKTLGGLTVWSRTAEVVARRDSAASLEDVLRAVLPGGSVTGAPKVRAMEVIARLEPWRRGAYTGAFGYVSRGGDVELAMAIRTIQAGAPGGVERERLACYFAGGGIVADSDPERELEETRWKAAQLEMLGRNARAKGTAEEVTG
jgi:anthranilate/para-aminobenzoate synthase component I